MSLFKGVGVFFNQMEDLSRIQGLPIDWITPIMAPDQESVQGNRSKWTAWRNAMPTVKFCPWIVCDDPVEDAARIKYVWNTYPSEGIVLNCEKAYESGGKWKAQVLFKELGTALGSSCPLLLSYPSSPAEIFDMDYRTFERNGCWFAPQAYWNEFPDATATTLWKSTYLPNQLHVGRDYRLQLFGTSIKRWGRVQQWDGMQEAIIQDFASTKLYRLPVVRQSEGNYHYMTIAPSREFFDYKSPQLRKGKLLGFCAKERIVPTVGIYEVAGRTLPTPTEVKTQLDSIPSLPGASIYLGEYAWSSDYVRKTWESINQ